MMDMDDGRGGTAAGNTAPPPLPKPTLGGAAEDATAAAPLTTPTPFGGGGEPGGSLMLRPLHHHHHPSSSANVKLGKHQQQQQLPKGDAVGGAAGSIPGSPMALKSLPSPLRRSLRSYPSAAAILEAPSVPPGAAGADIFNRGRDALLLQQQQQRLQKQQRPRSQSEEDMAAAAGSSLPPSPPRPGAGGSSSGTTSPPLVMGMAHPPAAGPSPVRAQALGPRLSRHAPLPSFSPRKPPSSPVDASALPVPMPSPLPALTLVGSTAAGRSTPPAKLPGSRHPPSGGGSPRSTAAYSGRPPSPLQRSKTLPSTSSTPSRPSGAGGPSLHSPAPALSRTRSTGGGGGGGRRPGDASPSTAVAVGSLAGMDSPGAGARSSTTGSGMKGKKKVAFEQQHQQHHHQLSPPQRRAEEQRERSSSVGSSECDVESDAGYVASSPGSIATNDTDASSHLVAGRRGRGLRAAATNQRFAKAKPQGQPQARGKAMAGDLSQLPPERRRGLLALLHRLSADLDAEADGGCGAPVAPSPCPVPPEVVALQRRIQEAGPVVGGGVGVGAGAAPAEEAKGEDASSSGPSSPLLLGPAALRTQVLRDFGVKPTRAEAAALARFLLRSEGASARTWADAAAERENQGQGQEEPVLDYIGVRRFLLLGGAVGGGGDSQAAADAKGEDGKARDHRGEEGEEEDNGAAPKQPSVAVPVLRRRSILQEEAAKSELGFVPRDEDSRALLEKMGEAAACLDRHSCDARFRPRADGGGAGAGVPAKVSVEELEALGREGLGLQLAPTELQLVVRWFGGGGGGDGDGDGFTEAAGTPAQGTGGVDYDLFLQHYWALGAAAKARRRKEEAQTRFLRVLATVGVASDALRDDGASG